MNGIEMSQELKRKPGFQKGQSGNLRGRPKKVLGGDELLTTSVDAILERVIESALSGDMAAAALALEHYRSIRFNDKIR
jgi:hypothetical protein